MSTPHSAYINDLNRLGPPPVEDLRAQNTSRPLVGDLIAPGMLVRSSYGTGPYRVEEVRPHEAYPGFTCWSLCLKSRERDGTYRPGPADSWINEIVVEWDGEQPRFRKLFRANDDEVFLVEGHAFKTSRTGQMALF